MRKRFAIIAVLAAAFVQTATAQWVKLNTRSFSTLKDIYFQNSNTGWITGTDGTLLRTDDGGKTWQPIQKFTTDSLLQVYFTDASTGWMLCERNIYGRGRNPTSYLRKTTNGGVTWNKIEFEDAERERVTHLLFDKNGIGTAFGEGGIFYKLQEDGETWKKMRAAIHFLLLDGAYSDGQTGAIVGAGGTIVFTEDGGLTWSKATLLGDQDSRINAVVFTSNKLGWAVGSGGKLFTATGGGRLWRTQQTDVSANLNDIFFANSRDGWVVGDEGTILRTTNGGASWTEVRSRVSHNLNKVVFNGNRGFAIGMGGTLLATGDGIAAPDEDRPNITPKS